MDILVDGDILVYKAGFATEYPKYTVVWGPDFAKEFQYKKEAAKYLKEELEDEGVGGGEILTQTIIEPVQNALHIVDSMLGGIAAHFGAGVYDLQIGLTGVNNFRDEVAFTKPYKGNRNKPKPVHYTDVRDYLCKKYNVTMVDGQEADDWLGINQYINWWFDADSSCIVTIDKDLDMIPGRHYNPDKEEEYYIEPDEADRFFLHQLITGDYTDNIPGIPGMAEAKAATFLQDVPTNEAIEQIRDLYCSKYGESGNDVFEEQANLLWIRRGENQNWKEYWREHQVW